MISIDSQCECEPHNPDREDVSSMVTEGASANTADGNSRASRESGLLCSHSHRASIDSVYVYAIVPSVMYLLRTPHSASGASTTSLDDRVLREFGAAFELEKGRCSI